MGSERAAIYSKVWGSLLNLNGLEPEDESGLGDVPAERGIGYGGVIIDASGRVLLREPKNHFDGYVWTFPKGKALQGETEAEAALREAREESGYECENLARLPHPYVGGTGNNVFFVMRPKAEIGDPDGETATVQWVDADEAEALIRKTTNEVGRKRDLQVLADALEWWKERNA